MIQKYVDYLKRGVTVWKRWRQANPHTHPDLSGADLSHTSLKDVDLSYADLSHADLWHGDSYATESQALERKVGWVNK